MSTDTKRVDGLEDFLARIDDLTQLRDARDDVLIFGTSTRPNVEALVRYISECEDRELVTLFCRFVKKAAEYRRAELARR